jgi:hypothetical protein
MIRHHQPRAGWDMVQRRTSERKWCLESASRPVIAWRPTTHTRYPKIDGQPLGLGTHAGRAIHEHRLHPKPQGRRGQLLQHVVGDRLPRSGVVAMKVPLASSRLIPCHASKTFSGQLGVSVHQGNSAGRPGPNRTGSRLEIDTGYESLESQSRFAAWEWAWCDILCGCPQGARLLGL